MILARCCHSVNVVALCVTCDNVRGGECPSWYWWWSVLGTGDTGDHRWPGGGGTWGHSHMVTGPPPGPGEITPCILSSLHLASPANHPRYFVQLQVVCAFWIRRIKLKMFYVCICIWIIEIERCIFCVCVELKVSLVICNWNLAYFLIRILHHSSNF